VAGHRRAVSEALAVVILAGVAIAVAAAAVLFLGQAAQRAQPKGGVLSIQQAVLEVAGSGGNLLIRGVYQGAVEARAVAMLITVGGYTATAMNPVTAPPPPGAPIILGGQVLRPGEPFAMSVALFNLPSSLPSSGVAVVRYCYAPDYTTCGEAHAKFSVVYVG